MPATMQGPAIFLAQFAGDKAPFDSWAGITAWAAGLGYRGVQLPSGDARFFETQDHFSFCHKRCDVFHKFVDGASARRMCGIALTGHHSFLKTVINLTESHHTTLIYILREHLS